MRRAARGSSAGLPRCTTSAPGRCWRSRAPGAPSLMVPFTRAAVPEVDLAGGRLVIASVPGLFGDGDEPGTDAGESPP